MKKYKSSLIFCVLSICLIPQVNHACTGFCLSHSGQHLVGRNYDWYVDDCLIMVNKRGVHKTALKFPTKDYALPAQWTSKYGSITFNQYGREFCTSGMNEAGLVVQVLALTETKYPAPDSHPSITVGQWVQYQLDNSRTCKEVTANASQLYITPMPYNFGCHFFVCDKKGVCASIDFINGKLIYHTNETMPVKVLTNNTYAESVEYWKSGKLPVTDSWESIERFIQAAHMIKNHDLKTSKSLVDYAFDILTKVEMEDPNEVEGKRMRSSFIATEWSIVYDTHNLKIIYRTFENQKTRSIDLTKFDFSCKTPVKVLDIHSNLTGDVTSNFIDYTRKINRTLIGNACKKTAQLRDLPENELDGIAQYPESTVCIDK